MLLFLALFDLFNYLRRLRRARKPGLSPNPFPFEACGAVILDGYGFYIWGSVARLSFAFSLTNETGDVGPLYLKLLIS